MANLKKNKAQGQETTPQDTSVVTPTANYDQHSFILQAIMENQKAMGSLSTKIDNLTSSVAEQKIELSKLSGQATFLKGIIAATAVFIALIGFFIDKSWDKILEKMPSVNESSSDISNKH